MKDFFTFRKMVSASLIRFLYIVGAIIWTVAGVATLIQGDKYAAYVGLLALIVGNLFWRLICEVCVLFFSMHDILGSIEKNLREK